MTETTFREICELLALGVPLPYAVAMHKTTEPAFLKAAKKSPALAELLVRSSIVFIDMTLNKNGGVAGPI